MANQPLLENQQVLEKVADISQATTWSGAASALFFGLTAAEFAAFLGVGVALLGMVINACITFYFKYKAHQLEVKKAGLKE